MTTFGPGAVVQHDRARTARYFSNGIFLGVTFAGGIGLSPGAVGVTERVWDPGRKNESAPGRAAGAGERGYVRVRPT